MASYAPFLRILCARSFSRNEPSRTYKSSIFVVVFSYECMYPRAVVGCVYTRFCCVYFRVFARVCAAYFPLCLMRTNVRAVVWVPMWFGRKILSLTMTKRSMPSNNCTTIVTTSCLRGKECMWTSSHSPWLCCAYIKKNSWPHNFFATTDVSGCVLCVRASRQYSL